MQGFMRRGLQLLEMMVRDEALPHIPFIIGMCSACGYSGYLAIVCYGRGRTQFGRAVMHLRSTRFASVLKDFGSAGAVRLHMKLRRYVSMAVNDSKPDDQQ
jgi:hypothetical protein